MVEIRACILHRSVFIPEETVVCDITVANQNVKSLANAMKQKSHQRHSSDTRIIAPNSWTKGMSMNAKLSEDNVVTLAYASAQIYCQCTLNDRRFRLPQNSISKADHASKHTSFSPDQGL